MRSKKGSWWNRWPNDIYNWGRVRRTQLLVEINKINKQNKGSKSTKSWNLMTGFDAHFEKWIEGEQGLGTESDYIPSAIRLLHACPNAIDTATVWLHLSDFSESNASPLVVGIKEGDACAAKAGLLEGPRGLRALRERGEWLRTWWELDVKISRFWPDLDFNCRTRTRSLTTSGRLAMAALVLYTMPGKLRLVWQFFNLFVFQAQCQRRGGGD